MLLTPVPDRWDDPALLDHLARVRAPWDRLTRRIVRATLAKFLPTPAGSLVEIGAGGGQLREWLPSELATETTHTEPSEPLLAALRTRYPDAKAVRAEATALPFADGSVGAVLALCVLDTVSDLAAVRDEAARVLKPGGAFVHFLDLATSPDCLFPELIAGGELPLTNFARDSALRSVLTDEQKRALPPSDEFDEVLAIKWEPFARFVGMLEAARHPLIADLGPYSHLTQPGRLDPDRLAREVMHASGDPERLLKLNKALLTLTLTAKQQGREWPLRAVSVRSHLRKKLRTAFAPESGFAIEFAGPVAAREGVPADATLSPETRFVLRHAGRTTARPRVAVDLHGTTCEFLDNQPLCSGTSAEGDVVRETTVEVLVARRG